MLLTWWFGGVGWGQCAWCKRRWCVPSLPFFSPSTLTMTMTTSSTSGYLASYMRQSAAMVEGGCLGELRVGGDGGSVSHRTPAVRCASLSRRLPLLRPCINRLRSQGAGPRHPERWRRRGRRAGGPLSDRGAARTYGPLSSRPAGRRLWPGSRVREQQRRHTPGALCQKGGAGAR